MREVFDWCVQFLYWLAPKIGMNYVEINIWLFIIIQPALILLFAYLWLRERNRQFYRPKVNGFGLYMRDVNSLSNR